MEGAVCVVELASLQVQEEAGVRLQTQQPVEREGSRAVVRAIVERRDLIVLPRLEALLEERLSSRVQRSDWLKVQNNNIPYI